jgi:hypothetical protein
MVILHPPSSVHNFAQFHAVGTSIAAIIVLLVCSGSGRVSAKDAFTLYENNTGWADGEPFLLARLLYLTMRRWLGIPLSLYVYHVDANGV